MRFAATIKLYLAARKLFNSEYSGSPHRTSLMNRTGASGRGSKIVETSPGELRFSSGFLANHRKRGALRVDRLYDPGAAWNLVRPLCHLPAALRGACGGGRHAVD